MRLASEHDFVIVGAVGTGDEIGTKIEGVRIDGDPAGAMEAAEVVIDFSHPQALPAIARACAARAIPLVSGTTGVDDAGVRALDELARTAPVLWAANMSFGVQLLSELVQQATRRLGLAFDVEIVETHHGKKIDAPSGTAKRLVEAARNGFDSAGATIHGRSGQVGARPRGEIGVHAVRGGDVIGDHTVMLLGQGERLELTHRATSRDLFAHGALRAARYLMGRPAGRYTIKDLLGG
jgi:4-hydroxy-tetrahydrodipicolinate reductase